MCLFVWKGKKRARESERDEKVRFPHLLLHYTRLMPIIIQMAARVEKKVCRAAQSIYI